MFTLLHILTFLSSSPLIGLVFPFFILRPSAAPSWRSPDQHRLSSPPSHCQSILGVETASTDTGPWQREELIANHRGNSGIVVNAASAALFINVRGHGSSIFRDGKRLVLVIFLLSAALWAQIDFITTLIDPTALPSCQIGVIFTTAFDQLARFSIEQHLLWVANDGAPASAVQYVLQGLVAGRFVMGVVFVVLSRAEFNTVCVPLSLVLIVGIVVVVLDAVVILALAVRATSAGVFRKMQDGGHDAARGKAFIAVLLGMVIWTAVSFLVTPKGLSTFVTNLFCRPVLPCCWASPPSTTYSGALFLREASPY